MLWSIALFLLPGLCRVEREVNLALSVYSSVGPSSQNGTILSPPFENVIPQFKGTETCKTGKSWRTVSMVRLLFPPQGCK